jgi:type I restriction enzyme, S subunit
MLPDGWKLKLTDEICVKITKGTTPPNEEIQQTGDIPFLRVNNLTVGGSRSLQGAMIFVTPKAHQTELARSKSLPDDTLINIVGPPLSKVTLLNRAYSEYNLNQAIVLLRPSRTTVEPEFLFYFMTDPRFC